MGSRHGSRDAEIQNVAKTLESAVEHPITDNPLVTVTEYRVGEVIGLESRDIEQVKTDGFQYKMRT